MAVAMGAVLCSGFTSCSSDDDADTSAVNGTQSALNAACAQWKVARADWENTEAFLFGAADQYSIDPHTDTWPVDQEALSNTLKDETVMNDIDNKVKSLNSGLLGYHGIEYVLFRNGQPRDISQLTQLEYKYVCAVAKDLYNATCVLQTTWDGTTSGEKYDNTIAYLKSHSTLDDDGNVTGEGMSYKNFGKEFTTAGSGDYDTNLDATIEIIEGARDIIGEVGGSKIGLPYTGQDDSYIESPYAYNSITDFYDNIVSCKNAFYGERDAATPTENSLFYFCLNSGNAQMIQQTKICQEKLETALTAIKNMKAPFATYYKDASAKTAMDALDDLDSELGELEDMLKEFASNTTVQSQCGKINASYVTNVVVNTYRSLCDNAKLLYEAIVKIQN